MFIDAGVLKILTYLYTYIHTFTGALVIRKFLVTKAATVVPCTNLIHTKLFTPSIQIVTLIQIFK